MDKHPDKASWIEANLIDDKDRVEIEKKDAYFTVPKRQPVKPSKQQPKTEDNEPPTPPPLLKIKEETENGQLPSTENLLDALDWMQAETWRLYRGGK